MKNKNIVSLSGQVVEEPNCVQIGDLDTEFFELKVCVTRKSGEQDILPVTIKKIPGEPVGKGCYIYVSGELRSVTKINAGKRSLKVFVRGHSYSTSKTQGLNNNLVILEGFVTKPVTYRFTPSGKEISDIFLANNDDRGNSHYLPCVVWGDCARFVKDFPVGSKISIVGRLQSREFTKIIDGVEKKRTAYEVSGKEVSLLKEPNHFNYD